MNPELKSWLMTAGTDIVIDFLAGIFAGLATLSETGDYTAAAIMAIVTASFRSVAKAGLNKASQKLKKLKSQ